MNALRELNRNVSVIHSAPNNRIENCMPSIHSKTKKPREWVLAK